jgi:two-component system NarL family response regulator
MRVLLVDNRTLFLQGLQSILQAGGIDVVGIALNVQEALVKAGLLEPDVVILNISGASRKSAATIRRIARVIPAARIIVFADGEENLKAAVKSGASGFLLSEIEGDELLNKLHGMEMRAVKY